MKIKHVITSGCSFSDAGSEWAWPRVFEKYITQKYPHLTFNHVGMGSQGQELVQKKASLAVIEALEKYQPDEIAVIVMWTGTERKTFYVDNKQFIEEVAEGWKQGSHWWGIQFADLKNNFDLDTYVIHPTMNMPTNYNKDEGWYICNYLMPDSNITKEYFNLSSTIIGPATVSLENIIMLQNLCKLNGVNIFQTFYREYVYTDIVENKDHLNLNYLYKQWDHDTIITTTGIYEHLRPTLEDHQQWEMGGIFKKIFKMGHWTDETSQYFCTDNWHPNELGATKWITEVLEPKLNDKGFFK